MLSCYSARRCVGGCRSSSCVSDDSRCCPNGRRDHDFNRHSYSRHFGSKLSATKRSTKVSTVEKRKLDEKSGTEDKIWAPTRDVCEQLDLFGRLIPHTVGLQARDPGETGTNVRRVGGYGQGLFAVCHTSKTVPGVVPVAKLRHSSSAAKHGGDSKYYAALTRTAWSLLSVTPSAEKGARLWASSSQTHLQCQQSTSPEGPRFKLINIRFASFDTVRSRGSQGHTHTHTHTHTTVTGILGSTVPPSMADPAASESPASSVGPGSASEKNAAGAPATGTTASTTPSAPVKQRSCLTCRQRKVRCDKASPCSNCRRADIACVFPSTDRPPRWARRLRAGLGPPQQPSQQQQQQQQPPHARPAAAGGLSSAGGAGGSINAVDAGLVIERLRHLENLVRELTSGARSAEEGSERATAKGNPTTQWPDKVGGASGGDETRTSSQSPVNQAPSPPVMEQFGRLVLDEASRSRYVSSGFWSRVNDEVRRDFLCSCLYFSFHALLLGLTL